MNFFFLFCQHPFFQFDMLFLLLMLMFLSQENLGGKIFGRTIVHFFFTMNLYLYSLYLYSFWLFFTLFLWAYVFLRIKLGKNGLFLCCFWLRTWHHLISSSFFEQFKLLLLFSNFSTFFVVAVAVAVAVVIVVCCCIFLIVDFDTEKKSLYSICWHTFYVFFWQ